MSVRVVQTLVTHSLDYLISNSTRAESDILMCDSVIRVLKLGC